MTRKMTIATWMVVIGGAVTGALLWPHRLPDWLGKGAALLGTLACIGSAVTGVAARKIGGAESLGWILLGACFVTSAYAPRSIWYASSLLALAGILVLWRARHSRARRIGSGQAP